MFPVCLSARAPFSSVLLLRARRFSRGGTRDPRVSPCPQRHACHCGFPAADKLRAAPWVARGAIARGAARLAVRLRKSL
uniref:Uncharacterized protein n=1 Tax=Variovorax paradoxus TaxID=34073 RepID=K0PW35_VARPD|nr:hypothetical protein [Variovorax paradoxus]